jgi:hypothetical protein
MFFMVAIIPSSISVSVSISVVIVNIVFVFIFTFLVFGFGTFLSFDYFLWFVDSDHSACFYHLGCFDCFDCVHYF